MAYIPPPLMEQLPRTGRGFLGGQETYKEFRDLLYSVIRAQRPMTVRQMFYQAVVRGWVHKTDYSDPKLGNGYSMIQQDLAKMRREGMISYDWIVDESRRPRGFSRQ
jgi:hypothetical protein